MYSTKHFDFPFETEEVKKGATNLEKYYDIVETYLGKQLDLKMVIDFKEQYFFDFDKNIIILPVQMLRMPNFAIKEMAMLMIYHVLGKSFKFPLEEMNFASYFVDSVIYNKKECSPREVVKILVDEGRYIPLEDCYASSPNNISMHEMATFTRYLIDTFGYEKYKEFYKSGDFEKVFEKSLKQLEKQFLFGLQAEDAKI